jgi:hypothetical protein
MKISPNNTHTMDCTRNAKKINNPNNIKLAITLRLRENQNMQASKIKIPEVIKFCESIFFS